MSAELCNNVSRYDGVKFGSEGNSFIYLEFKENDSKNVSRTFSGVVGSVGSVHFQIVPWSGLYFSRSIGPFLCSRY